MIWEIAPRLADVYPRAHFATMEAHGLDGTSDRAAFDALKDNELAHIRDAHQGYDRKTDAALPPLCHYVAYYKRFKKTYHVLLQLESVLFKGRGVPSVGVPVEAMFLAELKHLLLGGCYDLDATVGAVGVDVATGDESFETVSGERQPVARDDMILRDSAGVMGATVHGPERRTLVAENSRNVLFVIYGVEGVTAADARGQLADLTRYLSVGLPSAEVGPIHVWAADGTEVG